jgi:hypothetical protein
MLFVVIINILNQGYILIVHYVLDYCIVYKHKCACHVLKFLEICLHKGDATECVSHEVRPFIKECYNCGCTMNYENSLVQRGMQHRL